MDKSLYHPKHWPSWLLIFIIRCLVSTPISWQQKLGEKLGNFAYNKLHKRRYFVETNIAICFPELSKQEQDDLVKAALISTAKGFVETFYSWWVSDKDILALSELSGQELIKAAQDEGRGVLLIGAHFPTLDVSGRVIGYHQDMDVVYKAEKKNLVVDHCLAAARNRNFENVIEKQDMRQVIRNLKKGRVVWYAPDQDFGRKLSVFAPFFGFPTATIANTGKILKMTGAKPLLYATHRLEKNGKPFYQCKIIDPFTEDSFDTDEVGSATAINKALEDAIREYPEQYHWVHERFRTRPDGEPKLYDYKKYLNEQQ